MQNTTNIDNIEVTSCARLSITDYSQLPLIMTVPEVAAFLEVSDATIYSMVRSKELPAIRIQRQYRIPRDLFIKFLGIGSA